MSKKHFGLIGGVLAHSYSPQIHSLFGEYDYKLCELEKSELDSFFASNELDGFNVTIPYKQDAMRYCDTLSERARSIGCVNTVLRRENGSFFGDNTDYYGFSTLLGEAPPAGKALVLGSGGSSKTVRAVLRDRGYTDIVVISRGGEDNYENISRHHDASLIVNTTPVGMYPNNGAAPVSLEGFTRLKLVIDLIYNPQRTALVLDAESRGIEARGGLLMLVAQGKLASELFTDSVISSEHMNKAFGTLEQGMKNIVLIGMPGCGKTTIGRRIAELAGRSFFDSDEEYERIYGVGAGESIRNCGEKAFRQEESLVLSELCKKSESVIATGGGVVTVKENYNIMHQNSTIVYLERELCELCGEDRPLSQSLGVEALYAARRDAYERMCDFKVKVDGADKTANEVLARIGMKH